MKISEILEKSKKATQGLLLTNKGTSKEKIYKDEIFEGLKTDKEKKRARVKIRNHVDSIFESIIAAKKENKKSIITKLAKDFAEIYVEAYRINDYSFSSVASENKKDKDMVLKALEIIKTELKIK